MPRENASFVAKRYTPAHPGYLRAEPQTGAKRPDLTRLSGMTFAARAGRRDPAAAIWREWHGECIIAPWPIVVRYRLRPFHSRW